MTAPHRPGNHRWRDYEETELEYTGEFEEE